MSHAKRLIHESVAVGPFQCNCHVVADEDTREAVVIDPGDEPDRILAVVRDLGVRVTALLHTHCHLDHITGTKRVKEAAGGDIWIHEGDRPLYDGLKRQYLDMPVLFGIWLGEGDDPLPVAGYLRDGQEFRVGAQTLRVLHTPGHTPGSCCFSMETAADRVVFSGDTLFARSIGRTDLPGGDEATEVTSIRRRLFTLDPDTIVYPGHGPTTRIADERRSNPYAGGV